MFDIGFWEVSFCGLIGLLVLGPDKLLSTIRSLSKLINSVKQMATQLSADLSKELDVKNMEQQLDIANKNTQKNLKG